MLMYAISPLQLQAATSHPQFPELNSLINSIYFYGVRARGLRMGVRALHIIIGEAEARAGEVSSRNRARA
jgi:hypothetical protein